MLKVIISLAPCPLIRHMTEPGIDARICSCDTMTIIPSLSSTVTRVAYVDGLPPLVTLSLEPTLYIGMLSPPVPI